MTHSPLRSFRDKATGPARLRASLRRSTRPLGSLLASLDAPRAVRAEVAPGVLGGDIFNVMSARLRGLLQNAEPPAAPHDATRTKRTMFQQTFGTNHDSATCAPFVRPARPAKKIGTHAAPPPEFTRRAPSDVPPHAIQNVAAKARAAATSDVTKLAPPETPAEVKTFDQARAQFPTATGDAPMPPRAATTADSVLVIKLREYWQLGERAQQSPDKSTPPQFAPAPAPAKSAQTLPVAPGRDAASSRWPEVTGQQLARKLSAAASGAAANSFKRAQQTVNTDSPERIEIQNTFNVEVRADGAGGAGPSADLAESIADILREQAIQHGIDLT